MPKYELRSHVMSILEKLKVHSRLATATERLRSPI
jgi:DNA-binding NarL/FixJ family response regulator